MIFYFSCYYRQQETEDVVIRTIKQATRFCFRQTQYTLLPKTSFLIETSKTCLPHVLQWNSCGMIFFLGKLWRTKFQTYNRSHISLDVLVSYDINDALTSFSSYNCYFKLCSHFCFSMSIISYFEESMHYKHKYISRKNNIDSKFHIRFLSHT